MTDLRNNGNNNYFQILVSSTTAEETTTTKAPPAQTQCKDGAFGIYTECRDCTTAGKYNIGLKLMH